PNPINPGVAALRWGTDGVQLSSGLGGRLPSDEVAALHRIGWQESPEYAHCCICLLFRLLSRDRQSSEQFAGRTRRYDEMQAECTLVPFAIADTSQEEAL